ncbi:OmpA family protein [Mangrovimonas sp. YM274]|uniref:OmpA family protein n=1 Tax=Mangrovimonas sp. YM274 TaxID=3070660 RepID=UPI0027DBE08D|nr:OmpA family protein [Mangrovimonas sp. YM274]WMI68760.1 OmpA family protein [Mangrovimonas sp. YM274]
MKNIHTYIAIAMMGGMSMTAQNKDTKKADELYGRFEYVEAAEAYGKLVEKGKGDAYVYTQLAEANYNIYNTEEAERWYAKAIESGNQDSETIYRYAQMLKANGKYSESNAQMAKFASMAPGDERAKAYRSAPDYIDEIKSTRKRFEVEDMSLNTEYSEFGAVEKDGDLYFVSARNTSRKTYGWNGEPFLDIYKFSKGEDGSYSEGDLLGKEINTKYHEGTVSFSPDGSTMYFSRESFFEKVYEKEDRTKISVIHLFRSKKVDGKWGPAEGFAMNSDSYSVKDPAVSADGKTLYFASNMPGGMGGFDLYRASINADGSLGEAENLGSKINTEGHEVFPFAGSNGELYFASNGHLGLGGLDMFQVKSDMSGVDNMGVPVNSSGDDFALSYDDATGMGYVSSNRSGGRGNDDIYRVRKVEEPCDTQLLVKIIDEKSKEAIAGAMATLYAANGEELGSATSDAQGMVSFSILCETDTELGVTSADHIGKRVSIEGSLEKEVKESVELAPIEELIVADQVVLNPIYFDFDKSNITAQAAFELDKLVQVMTKYPEMVILATSHTDSRGSDAYNMSLSDRRAKSTAQYVISKGIDKSRITGEGKGETEPKVDCGANCSEEQHQLNRRSEFIIVSGGPKTAN